MMPIIPGQDANEAYDVMSTAEHTRGPRRGSWTVMRNGISLHAKPGATWLSVSRAIRITA